MSKNTLFWAFYSTFLDIWLAIIFNLVLVRDKLHQIVHRIWRFYNIFGQLSGLFFIRFCIFSNIFKEAQFLFWTLIIGRRFLFCFVPFNLFRFGHIGFILATQHKFLWKLLLLPYFRLYSIFSYKIFFFFIIIFGILDAKLAQFNIATFLRKMVDVFFILINIFLTPLCHFLWFITCFC